MGNRHQTHKIEQITTHVMVCDSNPFLTKVGYMNGPNVLIRTTLLASNKEGKVFWLNDVITDWPLLC